MNKNYKEKLQDCRESIDRLDTILTYTLGERFQKTKEIGKIKAKNNLPSTDKNRELKQLKKILKIAKEIDLDTVFAEKIFNLIVNEVKNNHNKMKK